MDNQFCLKCGTRMAWKQIEDRPREVCPACGYVHFRQVKLAAAALIENSGELLLLQRAADPWKGDWNLPAGYVEVDEPPEKAAAREAREETGLHVVAVDLVGDYFYSDDPRGNGLLLVFRAEVLSGRLHFNAESLHAAYFGPDNLPENICGAGHRRAVEAWRLEMLGR